MQDAVPVGLLQRLGDGQPHAHGLLDRGRALGHALPQVAALEVLQRHVRRALLAADLIDGDDVGVVEAGGGAGLEEEALGCVAGAEQVRVDHLEGDLASQPGVPGQVDLAESPAPKKSDDREVVDLAPLGQCYPPRLCHG